jgi:hypothetical protein
MGYNADEISGWLGAIHKLDAALGAAGVESVEDPDDDDGHSFIFKHLLEVIGMDTDALPLG